MIEDRHRKFLCIGLNADRVRHSGRSLWDHLKGTHDLLAKWSVPQLIQLAGLFHSVYGTVSFKHNCLNGADPGHRGWVRVLIGDDAEELAYLFCAAPQRKKFLEPEPEWDDRFTGERISPRQEILGYLCEIEAANLLEQGGNLSTLRKLVLVPGISTKARLALYESLPESQNFQVF